MPIRYYDNIIDYCKTLSIPIDYGEAEIEFVKELKKPFYLNLSLEDIYDYFETSGKDPKKIIDYGTDSISYAQKINKNVFGIIGEIPYLYDLKILDTRNASESRGTFLNEKYSFQKEIMDFIEKNLINKNINKKSIFFPILEDIIKHEKEMLNVFQNNIPKKEYERLATIAEKFSSLVVSKFYLTLILGQFRRLLLDSANPKDLEQLIKTTEKKINEILTYIEQESDYDVLPIKKLIQLQLGCLFISLKYL